MLTARACSVGGGGACFSKFIQTLTEIHFITIFLSSLLRESFLLSISTLWSMSFEDAAGSFQVEGAFFFTCLVIGLLLY